MNRTLKVSLRLLIVFSLLVGLAPATVNADDGAVHYEVTVTNATRDQIFTPILVATHKKGVRLFSLGDPASEELAQLAEGGATAPLAEHLMAIPSVGQVVDSGGLLMPGETVTVTVKAGRGYKYISLAAMLVPTNDGFIALNSAKAPRGAKMVRYFSPVYDAGSEMNDELCESIPAGGGCAGEGHNVESGEGYVHIHAGIHGIGDLDADQYDWRNPAAKVTIKRIVQW